MDTTPSMFDQLLGDPGHAGRRSGRIISGELIPEDKPEGAPVWIISFADMVLLMMGFFVILFALNIQPFGRQPGGSAPEGGGAPAAGGNHVLDLTLSIREAFHNPVDIDSTDPRERLLVQRLIERRRQEESQQRGMAGDGRTVQSMRPAKHYAFSGGVWFEENSVALSESSRATISEFADEVRGLRVVIEIRGHATSIEAEAGHEHAMQLSWERANVVARGLAEQGVDWWRLRLVASADHDRREPHPASREADHKNARVELIQTNQVVPDRVPTQYAESEDAQTKQ